MAAADRQKAAEQIWSLYTLILNNGFEATVSHF